MADELGTICVSAFARLLYWPISTHRPHMYPGVGNGGGWRVRQGSTSLAPSPLCVNLLSAKTFFIAAMLL